MVKLTHFGNPILREVMPRVEVFDSTLVNRIEQMKELLAKEENGVGLAANQSNIRARMFLAILEDKLEVVVNPEMKIVSEEKNVGYEGCLSDPEGRLGRVERYSKIDVKYQDVEGNSISRILEDFDARVFQHELDHLNGILYIDKIYKNQIYSREEMKNMEEDTNTKS